MVKGRVLMAARGCPHLAIGKAGGHLWQDGGRDRNAKRTKQGQREAPPFVVRTAIVDSGVSRIACVLWREAFLETQGNGKGWGQQAHSNSNIE